MPPLTASAEKPAVKEKKGCRLPEDWQPSEDNRTYAAALGLDVDKTATNFREYWLAKAGESARKVNWSLTWQTWCRNAAERLPASQRRKVIDTSSPTWMRDNMGSML